MNEEKVNQQVEQSDEYYENNLIGIKTIESNSVSLNAIVFNTNTLSTALHRHDFIRIDFGEEINDSIEIQTRDYLIKIIGKNLTHLYILIVINRIFSITENTEKHHEDKTVVTKIIIASFSENKEE